MNKTELVKRMANIANASQKESAKFVDAFQEAVTDALISGGSVDIMGFGSFFLKKRDARTGMAFGKEIDMPASKTVGFKPGKTLKDAVN